MTRREASPPVLDDDGRPVELIPDDPSTLPMWLAMLAGPLLWVVHFLMVYLLAEWSCAPVSGDGTRPLTPDTLVTVILVLTGSVAAVIVVAGLWAWRRWRTLQGHQASFALVGSILAVGSLYAVLAVGLPAVALEPC